MRKILLTAAVCCLTLTCLTACQSAKTVADTSWKSAKEAKSLENYLKEQKTTIDMEVLKAEADSAESSLSQQFKAIALMSGMEYQNNLEALDLSSVSTTDIEKEMYRFNYPISGPYANKFWVKVNTDSENFWNSLNEAFYPYDSITPLLAAADQLDGQTLVSLVSSIPEGSSYQKVLKDAVDDWVNEKPGKLPQVGDELIKADYFKDWDLSSWKDAYLYSYTDPYHIRTQTLDEAIEYVGYMRNSILPILEPKFGEEEFKKLSEIDQENYYSTRMTIAVDEELQFQEKTEEGLPETIETEGKKVAAFYQNSQHGEFKDSPPPLRVLGDFMMSLPEHEYPKSLSEADYYLVLTPNYEFGEFYQDNSGNALKIQQVYSSTSIDLYDTKTGAFLRNLGNVMEQPPSSIVATTSDDKPRYPEMVSTDILNYIYRNINEPEKYITLTDHTTGLKPVLEKGERVILSNWEITYHSSEIVKGYDSGMYRFTANDGQQFAKGEFTITNLGTSKASFLPMINNPSKDVAVQLIDTERKTFYNNINAITDKNCLNTASLEPGESKKGVLIFEIPDEVAQGTEPLYVLVSLGTQKVVYLLK